jgi:hypothetical protein
MVSLWPGAVKTEYIEENVFQEGGFMNRPKSQNIFKDAESVEFAGQAVVKLSEDSKRISKTGKILWVCIFGQILSVTYIDNYFSHNFFFKKIISDLWY